jgi:mannose-6-phosphate isomerase-like protein (cupin superfamily)
MPEKERKEIIEAIDCVQEVILTDHPSNPKDMSVCESLQKVQPKIFANGGDRYHDNVPEVETCKNIGCEVVFNCGSGGKIQSSSWLTNNFFSQKQNSTSRSDSQITKINPKVIRPWGGYTVLKKTAKYWVKKLFIHKNARLSLQSHRYRNEICFVLGGEIKALVGNKTVKAKPNDVIFIPKLTKHRITGLSEACILEVAFGKVLERDIVRYADDYGRV